MLALVPDRPVALFPNNFRPRAMSDNRSQRRSGKHLRFDPPSTHACARARVAGIPESLSPLGRCLKTCPRKERTHGRRVDLLPLLSPQLNRVKTDFRKLPDAPTRALARVSSDFRQSRRRPFPASLRWPQFSPTVGSG